MILACMTSRATHVDIANDLSTDKFLQLLRRYGSIRGWPKKVYSDIGTQLVSASKELKSIVKNLDWEQVQNYVYKYGTEWSFSPADAPWYSRTAEALLKSVKRALSTAVGEQIMSYSEFHSLAHRACPFGKHARINFFGVFTTLWVCTITNNRWTAKKIWVWKICTFFPRYKIIMRQSNCPAPIS